jgi:hypothetical protein
MYSAIKERSSQSRRIHSATLRDEKNVVCLISRRRN